MGKASRKKQQSSRATATGEDNSRSSRNLHSGSLRKKPNSPETKNFRYYLAGVISLIAVLVYLSSLNNQFVNWDDDRYIIKNPHIHPLNFDLFRWAFSEFYASNWHPLTWISHAVDYAVWGLNPQGHHLTNLVFHAGNTFLVVLLSIRLLEMYRERTVQEGGSTFLDGRRAMIAGGMTGLLFGLHPLNVETVAWIAQRKTVLCGLFFLLSIMAYSGYVSRQGDRRAQEKSTGPLFFDTRYIVSLAFFILALLSKSMAVTLPAVLLILDWHPFKRVRSLKTFRAVFIEKLPFIACSLISSLLTILAQQAGGATKLMEIVPFSTRVLVAANAIIAYLWKTVFPMNLIPFYPYPHGVSLFSPMYLGVVLLLVGISSIFFISVKRNRVWLALWGYYIITLTPVLGLVQVGGQSMADRYMYLPSLSPFLAIALAVAWLHKNVDELEEHRLIVKVFGTCAAILVLVSLSYLTFRQVGTWSSSVELWNYVIKKEPGTALAYNNRGQAFLEKGELDNALEDFNKVIALNQSYDTAYNNRGIVFSKKGQFDKAMEDFNKAIALNQSYDEAYNNRGIVFGEKGLLDEAMEDFNKAIALNPYHSRAYFNRGYVYLKKENVESAVQNFQKACALGYEAACKAIQKIENSPRG